MKEYRYEDLTHPEPGRGLGARVPSCPGCGLAVILFDDDTHTCGEVADDSDPHRWNGLTYEDDPSPFSEATPPKDRTSVGGWYLGRRGYLGRLR